MHELLANITKHRFGPRLAESMGITYQAFREKVATTRHGKGYNGRNYRDPFTEQELRLHLEKILQEDLKKVAGNQTKLKHGHQANYESENFHEENGYVKRSGGYWEPVTIFVPKGMSEYSEFKRMGFHTSVPFGEIIKWD